MPKTDHFAMASPESQRQFNDLFSFAFVQGAVHAEDRDFYAQRFASDAVGVRHDLDLKVAGRVVERTGAAEVDVRSLPGYPPVSAPLDPTSYPEAWLRLTPKN